MEEIVEFHAQDLHAGFETDQQQQDQMNHSQICLHDDPNQQQQQHQIHQNFMSDDEDDTLMFYSDFPPLPDLPCMSSSSSSSSTPAPVKASASSSSSAFVSSPQPAETGLNSVDCMDEMMMMMMDTFEYGDLLKDSNEFFDPACIFRNEEQEADPLEDLNLEGFEEVGMEDLMMNMHEEGGNKNDEEKQNDVVVEEEDMAKVFLEWLRSNRDTVSADDLKNVRIKKATIDSAARRLGGGKEGMKQLLKLVLEWVQTNHLHKRKFKDVNEIDTHNLLASNLPCIQTLPPPPPPLYSPPMPGYVPGGGGDVYHSSHHGFSSHYQLLDSSLCWSTNDSNSNNLSTQFGPSSPHLNSFYDNYAAGPPTPPLQSQSFAAGYGGGHQYPYVGGENFQGQGGGGGCDNGSVRLDSSATKEARKKRMARQRRFSARHRHSHNGNSHQNQHPTQMDTNASDYCTMATAAQPNAGNWVNLPSPMVASTAPSSGFPVHSLPEPAVDQPNSSAQNQNYSPRIQRLGWKPEKNLRFLLQKVLKQSDVGNLGRIVLPKIEAETHLPELDARDGISIAMEDIVRYWPNNKSRMYVLENTGDFVKANGLQEGDFIVIYSDIKAGKYMIRGVKKQQAGSKPESKRAGKSQRSNPTTTTAANGTSSLPMTAATPKKQ